MARIKGAVTTRKRRKKILKLAKGFYGAKSKQFRTANQAVMRSLTNAYIGRKQKKRSHLFPCFPGRRYEFAYRSHRYGQITDME